MIHTLYVKQHRITGLKYLGKTTQHPYRYKGSGKYWKAHLKKHGYNVTTHIIGEYETKYQLRAAGVLHSEMWNVVEARDEHGVKFWANDNPETGDGGLGMKLSDEANRKISEAGRRREHKWRLHM